MLGEHVVEAQRVAQAHVLLRLVEREARAVEADEKVHDWPQLHRLVKDAAVAERDNRDVVVPPQPVQDGAHRPAVQLHVHAAHAHRHYHPCALL